VTRSGGFLQNAVVLSAILSWETLTPSLSGPYAKEGYAKDSIGSCIAR